MDFKKVEKAILRLKTFEPPEGYWLAFSGGKDSIVIDKLAQLAGVKYEAHHNFTTIDPPELVRYIKKHYPHVPWHRPRLTFWQLLVKKGFPPSRQKRYCCDELKEGGGSRRFVITGVRWAESEARSTRSGVETNVGSRSKKPGAILHLNNDNDEARMMVENCRMRTKHVLNPIIDWEDSDVWDFIHYYNLPYCSLYDEGFDRLGCIGCPLQSLNHRIRDFERWPRYKALYIQAFDRMIKGQKYKKHPDNEWKTGDDVMAWYMTDGHKKKV